MPELPEVETIRRQLEKHALGVDLQGISILTESIYRYDGDPKKLIPLGKLINVRRFGKLLILDTSTDLSFCIHLKMTGRVSLLAVGEKFLPHTHVVFHLGEKLLTFSDARKFGYVHGLLTTEVINLRFLQRLGKEPLKDLTVDDFQKLLSKTMRPIKSLLLDQTRIAGIGNIYACEALWMACIDPRRQAKSLTAKESKKLFLTIEEVLQEGIDRGGASDNTYRDLMGGKGKYQDFFKVYGRTGKPCLRCKTPLERFVIGGRGTWWCPPCQK